ncbi:hypothetical protein, variant [Aphanomyces invadans]|nr:hypothetical protein, variant [Aphanomyces invadans]ETV94353.1 hypothetical protein, variant [Aphanomyces invadans]|eukprot:XP_008877114.1 hypothetical protein, variant [Aphanomyces invadans]
MESMSPVQYDRLMALQRQRAARLIQRRWKEYTLSAQYPRSMSVHHIHAWDTDDGTADFDDNALYNSMDCTPSLPSKAIDPVVFLSKKQAIHQRVQDAVRTFSAKHPWKIPIQGDTKTASDTARRATYEKLQRETANWASRLQEHCTALRQPKLATDASVAAALARCEVRLQKLLAPSQLPSISNSGEDGGGTMPFLPKDRPRRDAAVAAHKAVVHSIEEASKASYYMPVGGRMHDMRQIRPPPPWEIQGHDKIWTWPHSFRVTVNTVDDEAPIKGDDSDNPIDQFLTRSAASRATEDPLHQGKRNSRDMQIEMDHLWLHYAEATSLPPSAMLANVTSVMTTHPSLLACQRASGKTGGQDDVFGLSFDAIVRSKTKHLVADITNQITFNTQLRLVEDHTKNAVAKARTPMATKEDDDMELIGGVDYGRLRRHHMATRIQRRVRGNKGRAEAQEIRAKYFVQVKGRAVRKGLCEECGDVRAVLQCDECQETSHFCPQCWVQVHSTRRRKTHVPKPMAIESTAPKPSTRCVQEPVGPVAIARQTAAPSRHVQPNPEIEDILSAALALPGTQEPLNMQPNSVQPLISDATVPSQSRQRMGAQVTPFELQPEGTRSTSRHPSTVVVAADVMLLDLVHQAANEAAPPVDDS